MQIAALCLDFVSVPKRPMLQWSPYPNLHQLESFYNPERLFTASTIFFITSTLQLQIVGAKSTTSALSAPHLSTIQEALNHPHSS